MTDDELIAEHMDPDPWLSIQDGRLFKYGTAVWVLIAALRANDQDAERVARDYDIPMEAMDAALAYYRRHQAIIDAKILLNEAAFA
jgi:hypothetical protein